MDRRFDPRSIVTPYAFSVHPDLLGMPLATPWQRFGAISIDLIVIGLLSQVGLGPLAIASVALLFWMATRKESRDMIGKAFKVAIGCLVIGILGIGVLVVALINSDAIQQAINEAERDTDGGFEVSSDEGGETTPLGELGFGDIVQGFQGIRSLQNAETAEEALDPMISLAEDALSTGISRSEVRELLEVLVPDSASWADEAEAVVDAALEALQEEPEATEVAGSTEEDPAAAGETEADPTPAEPDVPLVIEGPVADSVDRLNEALAERDEALEDATDDREDARRALARTQDELEAERNQGFMAWILGFVDELGIGFGWAALYLTIAHTLFKGRSIGKMMFRIRVVMIDQRPLSWWLSFERAGGYAAGFATGLLGFAQVFWDPNRQAIHDKVSETIVIQDGKKPVPGPWVAEGKAQWERGRAGSPPVKQQPKP